MNGDNPDDPRPAPDGSAASSRATAGFRPAISLDAVPSVTVAVDGATVAAPSIWSVADLLLSLGVGAYRSSVVSHAPRAPFCMMGTCFDCLVTVDGRRDRQGCLVRLRDGMTIERQRDGR